MKRSAGLAALLSDAGPALTPGPHHVQRGRFLPACFLVPHFMVVSFFSSSTLDATSNWPRRYLQYPLCRRCERSRISSATAGSS